MTNLAEHVKTCIGVFNPPRPLGCRICDIADQHVDNCINPWCGECVEIRSAQQSRRRAA